MNEEIEWVRSMRKKKKKKRMEGRNFFSSFHKRDVRAYVRACVCVCARASKSVCLLSLRNSYARVYCALLADIYIRIHKCII